MKLQIQYKSLSELVPYSGNVKKHPQKQIDMIKRSIDEFGFNDPIAIDKDGVIIEGHGRYEAAKQLKMDKVPTICLDGLTDEQRKAYTIVHNKLTMSTGFDIKMLQKEMNKIGKINLNKFGIDAKFFKDHDYKEKTHKSILNILNLGYANFDGVGRYDIPQIYPEYELPEIEEWIGFNYVLSDKDPENKAVHFFVDDYQFERLWNRPDQYIPYLKRYKCVLSPDFSPYCDMPLATQIYNHYRKHWLGAYWQSQGITVIPTIRASTDPRSLEFYLEGEPQGGVVAYSTMWSANTRDEIQEAFKREWEGLITVLEPKAVVVYGQILDFMKEANTELIQIPKFTQKRWEGN